MSNFACHYLLYLINTVSSFLPRSLPVTFFSSSVFSVNRMSGSSFSCLNDYLKEASFFSVMPYVVYFEECGYFLNPNMLFVKN